MHCSLDLYPERRLEGEREMGRLTDPNIQSCSQTQAQDRVGKQCLKGWDDRGWCSSPSCGEALPRK